VLVLTRVARALTVCALIATLSACQLTVRVSTKLDAKGGGTFALSMLLDKELRDQLQAGDQASSGGGLRTISELFDALRAKGWAVAKTEPAGGLVFEASRHFADSAGFDRVLAELSSARGQGQSRFGAFKFTLDYRTRRSFLRTTSRVFGTIDTTEMVRTAQDRQLRDVIGDHFQLEVQGVLPGAATVSRGDGTANDDRAVWRPQLGSRLDFAASSSALRVGSLMVMVVPILLLIAGLGWFLLGRRPRAVIPDTLPRGGGRVRTRAPVFTEQLLAIKPEGPAVADQSQTIDLREVHQPDQ
jgi:hypothetical protein